jgi:uncharacterized membrane protein (DUF485 family)
MKKRKVKKQSLFSKILVVIGCFAVAVYFVYQYFIQYKGWTHVQALAGTLEQGIIIGIAALVLIVFLIFKKNK